MKLAYLMMLTSSLPLFGAGKLERRIEKLEQEMNEIRTETLYGNVGAKTPSAAPAMNRFGPQLFIQMLYWKPFEGGTEFAFTDGASPAASPYLGNIVQFNFDWQWGFRLGLAYQFANPDWEVGCDYTRVKFHSSKTENAPQNGSLQPSGLPTASAANFSKASAKWAVAFSTLDFTLSRPYLARPTLSFKPAIGVRTAWITQRDQTKYYTSGSLTTQLKNTNDISSIGILGASQMNWRWTKNWGLYSSLAASLLYGKFSVAAVSSEGNFNISYDNYKVLPNVGLDTGLKWEMVLNRVKLFASAGYELQYWWRQNQRAHLNNGEFYSWLRYAEDLGFEGIHVNAGIDF